MRNSHLRAVALATAVVVLCAGCGFLLTGTTDPAAVKAIMDSIHARGCLYARASAAPWASAVTVIVGTWGQPAPELDQCFKSTPTGIP